ncbi:Programmed cell death 6-interacting protein [Eumeta japonica]|uniref:Programmed cell death 6-interacting protein n=1 Tax=Eumeta variegata TaxID=151549 RepID=A0A4C1WA95_EUMVA|nr:Programmed cell death 6-interacting protein [Eumeta japonica]
MADLLSVPLKKSSEVDIVKPLKNLIQSTYSSGSDSEDYTDALNELSRLRSNAIWKVFEKSSLEVIYRRNKIGNKLWNKVADMKQAQEQIRRHDEQVLRLGSSRYFHLMESHHVGVPNTVRGCDVGLWLEQITGSDHVNIGRS